MTPNPLARTSPGARLDRSFAWSVAFFTLPLFVTGVLTIAYLRGMFQYRAAVDDAATEVAGVLLRDVFDVVFARAGRGSADLFQSGFAAAGEAVTRDDLDRVAASLSHSSDSLRACDSCASLPVVGVAVLDTAADALAIRGGDPTVWRRRLGVIEVDKMTSAGRFFNAAASDEDGDWFYYVILAGRSGAPPLLLAAEVDLDRFGPELIEPAFRWVMETHDLTRTLEPDAVRLVVTHPSGRVMVDAGRPSDGPTYTLPLFGPDLVTSNIRRTRPLNASITLHPDALAVIIPGGRPTSPWPLVALSVVLALALTGIGVALLLRMRRFALAREHFIATVSHELRTPLSLLLAYAETVGLDRPTPESRRRAATVIVRETRRMTHLVENALAFSRGQASTATLNPEATELLAAVRDVVTDFEPLAADRGTRLEVVGAARVWSQVDGPALRQVLNNLLDNAVRHGPEGQLVTVTVQAVDPWAEIHVADEGPGLPPGSGRRIWDPFVLGAGGSGGTGLGLSIVRHLVDLHGGEVAASNGSEHGARFTVRFPLHPEGEEASWPAS